MKAITAFALLLAPVMATAQTTIVPIQNPSFEQRPVQDPAFQLPNAVMQTSKCYNYFQARNGYTNELPPGWNLTYRDSVWGAVDILQPLFPTDQCDGIPSAPDGSWMLYLNGATLSNELMTKPSDLQRTGTSLSQGRYTMTFFVANYFTVYPGYYEASISFGTIDPITQKIKGHELCSIDGWATWHFKEISFPCLTPGYLLGEWPDGSTVDPNAHIIMSLSALGGWPLLFDNVSLTFTPTN